MRITTPIHEAKIERLRVGNLVYITGTIYTARDTAHKRLVELIKSRKPLPIPLSNQIIYYAGPTPTKPGKIMGSIGPTTSYRMDPYTPLLLSKGLKITIGKGPRSEKVIESMKKHKAVYLAALGGAGALISKCVTKAEIVAYPELGTEAIYRLEVCDLPAIVINDTRGKDMYRNVLPKEDIEEVEEEVKKELKDEKIQKTKPSKRRRKNRV